MNSVEQSTYNWKGCVASLFKWAEANHVWIRPVGLGSYKEKTGRDTCAQFSLLSKKNISYYVYFNMAYVPYKSGKISVFSSLSLYDFNSDKLIHKEHINEPKDIIKFYDAIKEVIIDE